MGISRARCAACGRNAPTTRSTVEKEDGCIPRDVVVTAQSESETGQGACLSQ